MPEKPTQTLKRPSIRAQMISDREVDKIEDYQSKIRTLRDVQLSFERAIDELEAYRAQLEGYIADKRAEQEALGKQAVLPYQGQKSDLEKQIATLTSERNILSGSLDNLRKELSAVIDETAARKRALESKAAQLADKESSLTELEQRLKGQEAASDQRVKDLDRLQASYKATHEATLEVERRIEAKQAEVDRILTEIQKNQDAHAQSLLQLAQAKADLETATAHLKTAEAERATLKQREADAQKRYDDAVQIMKDAKVKERNANIKEIALRDVDRTLKRERAILRQAQAKFAEEVEAHRKQTGGS